jgi:transposase
MIFVGIDVASTKHDVFIMSHHGEILSQGVSFGNTLSEYRKLQYTILRIMESSQDSKVRIGLESTGLYHLNIMNYLTAQGFPVQEINPLLTSMTSKSKSLRKTKTDQIDAKAICMFLFQNQLDFKPYTPKLYNNEALKSLSRYRFSLVKEMSQMKVKLYTLVARSFPEFLNFFSSLHIKTSYAILHKYAIPSVIASTRIDGLSNFLYDSSMGHFNLDRAKKLKEIAKDTIGDKSAFYAVQIKSVVEIIWSFKSQISKIETEIKTIINEYFPFILTVPGVSYTTAAIIIGEIGDIQRFKSFDSLLAFSGMDPIVYQSGNYDASNTRPSKRGSHYLRWAIHQVSMHIVKRDAKFALYYHKKLEKEKKHYFVVLGHVGKKVLRVLYSILKYRLVYTAQ